MLNIIQLGLGNIGTKLIELLNTSTHRQKINYIALANSQNLYLETKGIKPELLQKLTQGPHTASHFLPSTKKKQTKKDLESLLEARHSLPDKVVLIDTTSVPDLDDLYHLALTHNINVVTANKGPLCQNYNSFEKIQEAAHTHQTNFLFETTVGAGLPIIQSLQNLINSGDSIEKIQGCFSGTLGFICWQLEQNKTFSEAVTKAKEQGYTEPDPRDDLSGQDVARKALILARLMGQKVKLSDIKLSPLFPSQMAQGSIDHFLKTLPDLDSDYQQKFKQASQNEKTLRYIATITPDQINVKLTEILQDSPIGRLQGPDNIAVIQTKRYHTKPLIIQGPGAGAEVTASGIIADLYRIL